MPSVRSLSVLMLLVLVVCFAAANVWFTVARSVIPLKLGGTVTHKERLIEKTPGVDDVYFMTLDSGRRIQVDGHVYETVAVGRTVRKSAWSRNLDVDGREVPLEWSRDVRGMLWAMPLTVAICVLLGLVTVIKDPGVLARR